MKHAFLIMAHNQFLSLKELISVLDDERNDIFVHFDKKNKEIPSLSTRHSRIVVLKNRINVIWGDVSQIQAEYALYKEAFEPGKYAYYHLISGVHFPLKSNSELHRWFNARNGACILRKVPYGNDEIAMRFGRYHFFLKHLISKRPFVNKTYHLGWRFLLWCQRVLGITRDTSFIHGKASQWCSLTEDAIKLILDNEKVVLYNFRRSFCSDEFFILSVLTNSSIPLIFDDRICYVDFVNTTPKVFSVTDLDILFASDALFFRKMADSSLVLAKKIEERIR